LPILSLFEETPFVLEPSEGSEPSEGLLIIPVANIIGTGLNGKKRNLK
jgi:hypothetical protein